MIATEKIKAVTGATKTVNFFLPLMRILLFLIQLLTEMLIFERLCYECITLESRTFSALKVKNISF